MGKLNVGKIELSKCLWVLTIQLPFGNFIDSFVDDTIAGVWKRQLAATNEPAPFMKIVLSKILVLANQNARDDYFKQQSKFVTTEGMRDKFAEYSTNIEGTFQ